MDRTQKGAWFLLAGAVLCLSGLGITCVAIFVPGNGLVGIGTAKLRAGLIVVCTVVGVVLVHRRQSPAEPEPDERDKALQKNATLACFVSVWASLALASLIPPLVVGNKGPIPVFLLPIINLVILYIAFLVYSVAVLVQYGTARPMSGPAKGALS